MNYPRFKNEPKTINTVEPLHFSHRSPKNKDEFLSAVKLLASQHCSDAISVHSGKSLIDVDKLSDFSISVKRLLDCDFASSGEQTIRYALASLYNTDDLIDTLQSRLLQQLEQRGYIKILRDDDGYAPKLSKKALFSSSCTSLDLQSQEQLCKLITNYSGW